MPLTISLAFLAPAQLSIKLLLLALDLTKLMLKLPHLLILSVELSTFLIKQGVLCVQLLVVSLKVKISPLQGNYTPLRILFDFFEL